MAIYDKIVQNKTNRRPLAGNPKHEILNPKQDEWTSNDGSLPAVGGTEDCKIMAKDKPNVFYNCRESSTNQAYFMQNKANFQKEQMDANSCATKDYENKRRRGLRKNKANQSQFRGSASSFAELLEVSAIWLNEAVFSFDLVVWPVILNAKVGSIYKAAHTGQKRDSYLRATQAGPYKRREGRYYHVNKPSHFS